MFAVCAPGFSGIYSDHRLLNIILESHPYAQFKKVQDEKEGAEWLAQHKAGRPVECIRNYGTAFTEFCVDMRWYHDSRYSYYSLDTSRFGNIRLEVRPSSILDVYQSSRCIMLRLESVPIAKPIQQECIILTRGLELVGDAIDLRLLVRDFSLFTALRAYTGDDQVVRQAQLAIRERKGGTSVTVA